MLKKKTLLVLLALAMLVPCVLMCFTSCGGGLDTDAAKEYVLDFMREIKAGDYDAAQEYLHPDIADDDVKAYIDSVEADERVDFQSGITVLAYTNFYQAIYDSKYDGSALELEMEIEVSGEDLEVYAVVVENDRGYGIYAFVID